MSAHGKKNIGMTIIELMLVMAIVSLFAGVSLATVRKGQTDGRDQTRKATLRKLQVYLELYKDNNGSYPSTGGAWYSSESGDAVSNNGGNWIPNLSPTYVRSLPTDPVGGASKISACSGWKSSYLYRSDDGNDYALLSHCSPEVAGWTTSDPFYDANRPTWAFKVCNGAHISGGNWVSCTAY